MVLLLPLGYYGALFCLAYQHTFRVSVEMALVYLGLAAMVVATLWRDTGGVFATVEVAGAIVLLLCAVPLVWLAVYVWKENEGRLSLRRTPGAVTVLLLMWTGVMAAVVRPCVRVYVRLVLRRRAPP